MLFTEDGELKLTDLQLSMRTNSDAQNTQLSMSDSTLNLKNRVPEVANNATLPPHLQKQLTPAVDVYSFGVLGVQLFNADSALEVQLQVQPQREMTPAPRGRRGELKVLPKPAPEAVKDPSSLEKLSMAAHVRAEAIALLHACLADKTPPRRGAAHCRGGVRAPAALGRRRGGGRHAARL